MKKIRAAVVGYGNIGQYVVEALEAAPDFEIAGIVRRSGAENKPAELEAYAVVKDIKELKDVDVAVLATPTRSVEEYAKEILAMGINTVDSFDIHTQITSLRRSLDESAKAGKAVAIISAGWDPGSDSVVRTLLEAIAPKGITSLAREIDRALSTLTDREKEIIQMFFGIGQQEMTLEEIGDRFGLTRERVRQIKEKAIRRLRQSNRSKLLKSYLG